EEALIQARKAAGRLDAWISLGVPSESEKATAATLFTNIALAHKNLHLYEDAVRYARREIELNRSAPSADMSAGNGLSIVADSLRYSGDLEGALEAIREARSHIDKAVFPGETARRA